MEAENKYRVVAWWSSGGRIRDIVSFFAVDAFIQVNDSPHEIYKSDLWFPAVAASTPRTRIHSGNLCDYAPHL
jgi:hypothetical protein